MKLFYFVFFLIAFAVLVNWLTHRRVDKLRDAGIYPLEGQETDADVDRLIQMGRKIDAIKVYRAVHHVGLKEAKEAVEKRQRELGQG
jgi:ribosomal protein L7/L12